MTKPGVSDAPSAAERGVLRRILSFRGEIRPVVSGVFAAGFSILILILVLELAIVLLILAGVEVFKYLLGPAVLSWLAHRIYL